MHINLLPAHFLLRMAIRRRIRNWAPVWLGLALLSLMTIGYSLHQLRQSQHELGALTERGYPLRTIQAETASCERERLDWDAEIRAFRAIESPDRTLALIGLLGNAARFAEPLQIQRMAYAAVSRSDAPTQPKAAERDRSPAKLATLSLHGIAGGDASLARFVDSLRSLKIFEQVELRSLSQFQTNAGDERKFHVECRFAE